MIKLSRTEISLYGYVKFKLEIQFTYEFVYLESMTRAKRNFKCSVGCGSKMIWWKEKLPNSKYLVHEVRPNLGEAFLAQILSIGLDAH